MPAWRCAPQRANGEDAEMVADMPTCKFGAAALDGAQIDAVGGELTAIDQSLLDKGANVDARLMRY